MRFLTLFYFASVLAPFAAHTQKPFYLADGLSDFSDQQLRQSNPVYVTSVGNDSMLISPEPGSYKYAAVYKRDAGEFFFRKVGGWSTTNMNYACVYTEAVILIEDGGSYLLFKSDQGQANQLLNATDKTPVLHVKDSLKSAIADIVHKKSAAEGKIVAVENKKIVSAYIRNLSSKKSDPVLERDIKVWSKNSTTTVYIVDASYYITRNVYGAALNKNIPAIIKYKYNGKCFVQWRAFGYEALGGGSFGKDLNTYNKGSYFIKATGAGNWLNMEQGVEYEVDCN